MENIFERNANNTSTNKQQSKRKAKYVISAPLLSTHYSVSTCVITINLQHNDGDMQHALFLIILKPRIKNLYRSYGNAL